MPDEPDARLVVLGIDHPYSKEPECDAEKEARKLLESRGSAPRLCRNALVFLAADRSRLQELIEAASRYLTWDSIVAEKERLDLSPNQVRQAQTQKETADAAVTARLPETYQWLLVPKQEKPQDPVTWQALRLTGQDALAVRASKKLRGDELLLTGFAGTRLRMELDRVPLWRGDPVPVAQLAEDLARYLYLPRLRDPAVLLAAVSDGVNQLSWPTDTFAFADSYDEAAGRYRGLRAGQAMPPSDATMQGLLVRPERAQRQMSEERPPVPPTPPGGGGDRTPPGPVIDPPKPPVAAQPKRFHGSVTLDPTRVGRDAGLIAEEVIAHLTGLVSARVTVTLEIDAEIPSGVPDNVVRTVTENSRTLKFTSQGFEKE